MPQNRSRLEDRGADDEAATALDQIDRAGQDRLLEVARPQHRRPLRRDAAVVEPDHRLVACERVHRRDHEVGGDRDDADLLAVPYQRLREPGEARLVHALLALDDRGQPLGQLHVGVDDALQLRAQQAEPAEHVRPQRVTGGVAPVQLEEPGQDRERERGGDRGCVRQPHHRPSLRLAPHHRRSPGSAPSAADCMRSIPNQPEIEAFCCGSAVASHPPAATRDPTGS